MQIPARLGQWDALRLIVDQQANLSIREYRVEHSLEPLQLFSVIDIDDFGLDFVPLIQISGLLLHGCEVCGTPAHDQIEALSCKALAVGPPELIDRVQHHDPGFPKALLQCPVAKFLMDAVLEDLSEVSESKLGQAKHAVDGEQLQNSLRLQTVVDSRSCELWRRLRECHGLLRGHLRSAEHQ